MKQYLHLLQTILDKGKQRKDRTGVGTIGLFGPQIEFDMADGFPLLTTKKIHTRSVIYELLWFLRGDTNVQWLNEHGVSIWNEWADVEGNLGPVYGEQWVRWAGAIIKPGSHCYEVKFANQIQRLVNDLKNNPWSRRHIVSAWNPTQIEFMALPPCHTLWQCHVEDNPDIETVLVGDPLPTTRVTIDHGVKTLNLKLYARSIDTFLGLPFNIASYAFLLHMLAQVVGMKPGRLIITFGDVHIYLNHLEQVKEQLSREPRPLPKLLLSQNVTDIFDFKFEDFSIVGYDPHPSIKAPIAV